MRRFPHEHIGLAGGRGKAGGLINEDEDNNSRGRSLEVRPSRVEGASAVPSFVKEAANAKQGGEMGREALPDNIFSRI